MKPTAGRLRTFSSILLRLFFLSVCVLAGACSSDNPTTDASTADSGPSAAAKKSCKIDKPDTYTTTSSGYGSASYAVVSGSKTPHSNSVPLMVGQDKAIGGMLYGSSQGCSATLVADRAVITASHCVVQYYLWDGDPATVSKYTIDPSDVSFGVGTDMKNPTYTFAVKEIHVNPIVQMSFDHLENDIAVLILKESATQKVPGIVPIPVNLEAIESSALGQTVEMGGFGSLACNTYNFSPIRYFAKMEISKVAAKDLGVKSVSGSASMGDSGSGLLLKRSDGRTRVASVLSVGADYTCTENAGPRIDAYGHWLSGLLADGCGAMTSTGSCVKDVAIRCDGNEIISEDCTTTKKSCGKDTCGLYRCIDKPASTDERCQGLDYFGRCNGDVAEWCIGGQYKSRSCAAFGQSCAKSPNPWVGYTCSGSSPDGGVGDGGSGKEAGWPDFMVGTASCEALTTCLDKCGNTFWCQYDCFYAGSSKAKSLWGNWTWCLYCSEQEDSTSCDENSSFYGKCKTACASRTTTCSDCLNTYCGDKEKTCQSDQREAGAQTDATQKDAGAPKEAGGPNG